MNKQTNKFELPVPWQHRLLLWCLIGALALGQLQRIQLTATIAGYWHEFLLVASIAMALLNPDVRRYLQTQAAQRSVLRSPWLVFGIWAVCVTGISAVVAGDTVPILYLLRIALIGAGAWSVRFLFRSNPGYLRHAMIGLGILWAVLGILQFLLIPDTRFLFVLGWDEHYYRLIGTLFDPAFLGMTMVLASIATAATWPQSNIGKKVTLLTLFASVCLLTYSRASYTALALAWAGIFLLHRKNVTSLLISAILASTVLLLAPKPGGEGVTLTRSASIVARTTQISLLINTNTPTTILFGEGLFADHTVANPLSTELIEVPYHARVPDNLLILLLRGTGLVGLVLASYALYLTVPRMVQQNPYLAVAVISVLWHSQFNNTLLQPFVLLYLLLSFMRTEATKQT
jgi:hypothetical protein